MQETALYSLIVLSADDASKNSLQASGVVECSSKYVGDLLFQPKRCIVSKSAFELLKLVHEALKPGESMTVKDGAKQQRERECAWVSSDFLTKRPSFYIAFSPRHHWITWD
ncbi:uncharacterized protein [Elaeis guineensis]|uniref:Uncharacterized protein LOC114912731 isoform X1 n=1 Tax=Elaeis guineensis var. tenera TaxID=51953 RepID=A0A8N4EPU6_ELAGV|nr:uncharacterized protein LOC114912731 isoform X1 [Elaeis guineensis]